MSSGVSVRPAIMKMCSGNFTSNTHSQRVVYICFHLFIYLLILIIFLTALILLIPRFMICDYDHSQTSPMCPHLLTIFSYYTCLLDTYGLIVPDHHQCTELLLSVSLHWNQKYLRLSLVFWDWLLPFCEVCSAYHKRFMWILAKCWWWL